MKKLRWGFTIVEVLVVITVMGILIGLSVVVLNGAEAESRDRERRDDIESMALELEAKYMKGSATMGSYYPGVNSMAGFDSFDGISPKLLRTPGVTVDQPVSLVPATNNIETVAGVMPKPTPESYVYQPIADNGALCMNDPCRRFNLYYRLEVDNTVYKVESLRR